MVKYIMNVIKEWTAVASNKPGFIYWMYEQRLPRVTRIITGINLLSFHSLAFQSKQNTPIKEYTIADIYTTLTLGPYVYAIFPE